MSKELKAYCPYANRDGFYHKSDVDALLAEKDAEIAELKAENERLKEALERTEGWYWSCDVKRKNFKYKNRIARRALYKACANWAKCEERISNMEAYDASEYLPSAENKFRKKAERWSEMESKCRAKAEEYK